MKKILFLLDYPIDLIGGSQLSTITICEKIVAQNVKYNATVFCPKRMNNTQYNFKIVEYERDVNVLQKLSCLKKIIELENPDIIHAEMPYSALLTCILRKIHIIKHLKIVFTDRGLFSGYSAKTKVLFSLLFKEIDLLICTTLLNSIEWKKTISADKILVIPNCVSKEFEDALPLILDYNEKNSITIGFAGRITEVKNWDLAISICRELKEQNMKIKYKFAFSAFSTREKKQMEKYIEKLSNELGSSFEYYVDLKQTQMVDFYLYTDIFILTSKFESFGKTAIEAMACGCLVLGTNVGGLREIINNSQNRFEISDPQKCIERIKYFYCNPSILVEEKKHYREIYKKLYSVSSNYDAHLLAYERLYHEQ